MSTMQVSSPPEPMVPGRYVLIAQELAPRFAERAARYDREGAYPDESIDDLIDSGYTAMTVPEQYGGGGASLEELCRAQEILASACASTAFAINMHVHGVGMLNLVEAAQFEWAYEEIACRRGLIAGGFSEPGVGGNWWYPATRVVRDGHGFWISGQKSFFTGYPRSTLLFLTGAIEDDRGAKHAVGFLVPRPHKGLRVTREWDALGMRATGSHTLAIDRLFIDEKYMIGGPGEVPFLFMKAVHWAWCSFAAVFIGIAAGALEHVIKEMTERKLAILPKPLSHLPGVQFRVAEMRVKLEAARALLYRRARQGAGLVEEPIAHYVDMSLMKLSACQLAQEVVSLGMQLLGGSGYPASSPLQRMYRDVAAGPCLPPPPDVTLEWVGKLELGVPVLGEPRWGE